MGGQLLANSPRSLILCSARSGVLCIYYLISSSLWGYHQFWERKLRHEEVKGLAQGLTSSDWWTALRIQDQQFWRALHRTRGCTALHSYLCASLPPSRGKGSIGALEVQRQYSQICSEYLFFEKSWICFCRWPDVCYWRERQGSWWKPDTGFGSFLTASPVFSLSFVDQNGT